jgi:[ribosomal protein S5]-alanine N-acetyltransferase
LIRLTLLGADDAPELFAAIARSRALHEPWITSIATETELREYLDQPPDVRVTYGIREDAGRLAGVVSISAVIRGAFQNGFLGYYALAPFEGHGFMRAGLTVVLDRAFGEHGLHRVEANIQPDNVRSVGLVRSLGFRLEGHSPRYLRIDGEWKDHDRYALTVEEWNAPGGCRPTGEST